MLKRFILWSFDFGDFAIKVFKIFNEDLFIGDFSYEDLFTRDFSLKIWDFFFFFEKLSWRFEKKRFIHGDFSFEIWRFFLEVHSRDFSIAILKNFNEDLSIGDFSFDDLKIFNEDLFIGDFFFWRFVRGDFSLKIYFGDFSFGIWFWRFFLWKLEIFPFGRFVRGDFSLKIYSGDWTFEKILMKIYSWIFFLEDLFLEIFPLKFWKFLLKICSLEIFPLECGFGDFSFWKWRLF